MSWTTAPPAAGREAGWDDGCTVLHVDVDAFYASVSLLAHPQLRGRPVVVGGAGARGVVLSATYEARARGVRSAMPMARARRLCPEAVVLPPDHEGYADASRAVMDVLSTITPAVEQGGAEEAYLDVTGVRRHLGPPAAVARAVRAGVAEATRLTCSVGVAATKAVAKVASARAKPDGLLVVPPARTLEFLHPLPVGVLAGVGERAGARLAELGLHTVADLAATPVATLRRALGDAAGGHLHDLAHGRDPRPVVPDDPDRAGGEGGRSSGAQATFSRDLDDADLVEVELLRLAVRTAANLRRAGLAGRTVVVVVRSLVPSGELTTASRSKTLPEATDLARDVHAVAVGLWRSAAPVRVRVRMLGVRVEGLVSAATAPRQLRLGERDRGWRHAEEAAARAGERFGRAAVVPAALLQRPGAHGRG